MNDMNDMNDMNAEVAEAVATLLAATPSPTPTRDLPKLYTVPEATALLRMSRAWVYQAVRDGRIDSVQLGRRRMIPASAIDALMGGDAAA